MYSTIHRHLVQTSCLCAFSSSQWTTAEVTPARARNFIVHGLCINSGIAHEHTPSFSNGLSWFMPLLPSAGMETAPSNIKSEWATTTPSSLRNTKRSTVLIKFSSIQATALTATITTWPWFVCHQGQWAKCRESVCHSAVMSFPPVCQWGRRECSNKPATVTLPAGVTQVRECVYVCMYVCGGARYGSLDVLNIISQNKINKYWMVCFEMW